MKISPHLILGTGWLLFNGAISVSHATAFEAEAPTSAPPTRLSQTGLYLDFSAKKIAPQNRPYEPQYPLWSDGAQKKRWAYLPPDTKVGTGKTATSSASKGNIDYWLFPIGTKFWKEFSFRERESGRWVRVETRISEKTAADRWQFSTYAWNDDESEAMLVGNEGAANVFSTELGTTHDIPSQAACLRCHSRGGDQVLGFEALQLSTDRDVVDPNASPATETDPITFRELVDRGTFTYVPPPLVHSEPRVSARNQTERAALGYLHSNCGSCHNPNGTASHSWLIFKQSAAARAGKPSATLTSAVERLAQIIHIPGQEETLLIRPGHPEASALVYAMKRLGDVKMPPIGNKVPDADAIALIEKWIREMPE